VNHVIASASEAISVFWNCRACSERSEESPIAPRNDKKEGTPLNIYDFFYISLIVSEVKMSIGKVKKKELKEEFGRHSKDSGSSEVQVAILTQRIKNLTGHLARYKKDQSSKRGLLQLVMRRRKLLDYVKNENREKYTEIIKKLGLRR